MSDVFESASQDETYALCPRKWAFKYLDGVESPANESAALGSEVHGQLELWLRDGRPLDLTTKAGKIAMAGLHLLPPPGTPGLSVEGHFGLEMGGHKWQGYKDFQVLGPVPLVGDHKTTKDFRWAKTPEELKKNPQACFYAADVMFRAGSKTADLLWIYYRTTGSPQAKPVYVPGITRDDITETLEGMCARADERKILRASGAKALDIPPDASACEAYGGCPYQSLCNLTSNDRVKSIMNQQMKASSFVQQMAARKAGAINPPALEAAPPGPPPAPVWNTATNAWEMPPAHAPAAMPEPMDTIPAPPPEHEPKKRGRPKKDSVAVTTENIDKFVGEVELPERDAQLATLFRQLSQVCLTISAAYEGAQ